MEYCRHVRTVALNNYLDALDKLQKWACSAAVGPSFSVSVPVSLFLFWIVFIWIGWNVSLFFWKVHLLFW